MTENKIQLSYRVDDKFYDIIARAALRKGLTVPAFNRYVLKKYFHDKQKTNTNT